MKPIPQYEQIDTLKLGRNMFPLNQRRLFDVDIGKVVPICAEFAYPNEVFDISARGLIKAQALLAPIYHKLKCYVYFFFVPARLLYSNFEEFVTGGVDGTNTDTIPRLFNSGITAGNAHVYRYNLWDYFGLPLINAGTGAAEDDITLTSDPPVWDMYHRAYWAIWRDFIRNENVQINYPNTSIPVGQGHSEEMTQLEAFMNSYTSSGDRYHYCDVPAFCLFLKDYATSALINTQRGTAPTVPISGLTSAEWATGSFVAYTEASGRTIKYKSSATGDPTLYVDTSETNARQNAEDMFNDNSVAFTATGITINDFREALATQHMLERNSRGGFRYCEQLLSVWGVAKQDIRLDRPELIGGYSTPIVISEVLQTGETGTTPQGNQSGHGMGLPEGYIGRYKTNEHGVVMGIAFIRPESIYMQGIPRHFSPETRYDLYRPEFANIGEQAVLKQELFFTRDGATTDETVFGYQGCWDELRNRRSIVCGQLANLLDYWHFARRFPSAPSLNETFLTTEYLSENRRNAFAVTDVVSKTFAEFLVQWENQITALRMMPRIPEPGLYKL